MNTRTVGFLHPGAMGVSLAASAIRTGCEALWASAGRSPETAARAAEHGLTDARTLEELCNRCSVIIAVCPPHAAREVAAQVLERSYRGVYADVNAISPTRTKEIGEIMRRADIDYVDGGIIGGPAWKPGGTWLYLSGASAQEVAACFASGPLETEVIGEEIGRASALKMCYAANTKGTTALLCAVVAASERLGVRGELERHWSRNGSTFAQQTHSRVTGVTAKAWRFAGEMREIAATFADSGMPDGFHLAAADVYERIAGFKGGERPGLEEVLHALTTGAVVDYGATWYHGSPRKIEVLAQGSTITQERDLARVFSHKPSAVCQESDGGGGHTFRHNGAAPGYLYAVADEVSARDIYPHPRTSMEPGQEWLTRRELSLELIESTMPRDDERITDVDALKGRRSFGRLGHRR